MKKIYAVVMLLFSSLLVSCIGSGGGLIELTVYSQLANTSGVMTGWFGQVMREKFNVRIIIVPDSDGVYATRMESGNLGDIVVWSNDGEQYQNAINANLLMDWEEDDLLAEYGPYILEHMPRALEKNREISGGTIYGFGHDVAPSDDDHASFFYTWDIRWDLYDQLGRPEVNDLDDYLQLLIDMKALEPQDINGNPKYAVSLWPDWDGDMVMYVKAMATAYFGHDELGVGHYNVQTGDFYGALDENSPYLEMLEFFFKLNMNGLLDPDSMTQTFDQMNAKVINGGTLFSIFNYAGSLSYNTDTNVDNGKMMLPLAPSAAQPLVYGLNPLGGSRVWSIGARTQYPELAMEILNWLSTPEGRMTSEYGPKDINWYYDEDGNTHFTELGRQMRYDQQTEFPEETGYHGKFDDGDFEINNTTWSLDAINPDSNGEKYHWEYWASNQTDPRNTVEAAWRQVNGVDNAQAYMGSLNYRLAVGSAYSTGIRDNELKVTWEQVTKTIVDYSWRAMFANNVGEYNFQIREMRRIANNYGYSQAVAWSQNEASIRYSIEQ